jgi:hypothetical protein
MDCSLMGLSVVSVTCSKAFASVRKGAPAGGFVRWLSVVAVPVADRALSALSVLLLLGIAGVGAAGMAPAEPTVQGRGEKTVGWDTYRRLDRLPYLSADSQTLQVSSFDRTGGDFDISNTSRVASTREYQKGKFSGCYQRSTR